MVFHEVDRRGSCSLPPLATYDRCENWITETLRLMGNEPRSGLKLYGMRAAYDVLRRGRLTPAWG